MKMFENISLKNATERLQAVVNRFPTTILFTTAFTIVLLLMIWENDFIPDDDSVLFMIAFYPPAAAVLGLSMHLWTEEQADKHKGFIKHVATQVCWFICCLITTLFLFDNLNGMGLAIGLFSIVTLIIASVFFLSFLKKRKDDIEAWNFAVNLIIGALVSTLVSGILLGGIELLIWGIEMLFDLDIDEEFYFSFVVICMIAINMVLFLMQIPEGEAKHNRDTNRMNDFGRVVVHALFVPLQYAYLITLYIYALSILISWELPTGGVVWLVTTMMIGMLFIISLIYPLLFHDNKPFDKKLVRWLSALAIPLLVLMTVGILRRISDYGFTVARAYVLLFNIWCYIVCIYLFVKRARYILWILISFVGVFFIASVGPWNITASTRRLLASQVDDIFEKTGVRLPLDYDRFDSLVNTMDRHDADILKGKLSYLKFDLNEDSLVSKWLDGLVDLSIRYYYEGPGGIDTTEVVINPADIDYPSARMEFEMTDMPKGNFVRILKVDQWQTNQDVEAQDSILTMSIGYSLDTLNYITTFEIPFRQLQEIHVDEAKRRPFVIDNEEAALLIWFFDVLDSNRDISKDIEKKDDEVEDKSQIPEEKDLHVEGIMFLRESAFNKEPIEE